MTQPDPQWAAILSELINLGDTGDPAERDNLIEQLHTRYLQLLRGGQTAGGLPYPDPTDPVAEGADAIRALAEAITSPLAIRPTVKLDTGNATVTADGRITFPRCNTITVTGLGALRRRHQIAIDIDGSVDPGGSGVTNGLLTMRVTKAGIVDSASNYFQNGQANIPQWVLANAVGNGAHLIVDVNGLGRSQFVRASLAGSAWDGATGAITVRSEALGYASIAVTDGFQLKFSTGVGSGTMKIMGWL